MAPRFEYCATLLIDMGETQLNKLQMAQNRATRVMLQYGRYIKVKHTLPIRCSLCPQETIKYMYI